MTDKLRDAAQQALEALEDLQGAACKANDKKLTRYIQAIAALRAALSQQDHRRTGCTAGTDEECVRRDCGAKCPALAQQDATCKQNLQVWVQPSGAFSWEPQDERYWVRMVPNAPSQQDAQAVEKHLADDERVAALCDLSYVAGMKAGWNFCVSDDSDGFERRQNSVGEAIRLLKSHRAPTPPAQAATCKQDLQVDALLDEMLEAAPTPPAQKGAKAMPLTEKQRVYFAQAWAMLEDYAIDQRQAGNDSIADGANASAHEIKLMLNAATMPPAQCVELTVEEIGEAALSAGCDPDYDDGAMVLRLARAIIQAYEKKNGIK